MRSGGRWPGVGFVGSKPSWSGCSQYSDRAFTRTEGIISVNETHQISIDDLNGYAYIYFMHDRFIYLLMA